MNAYEEYMLLIKRKVLVILALFVVLILLVGFGITLGAKKIAIIDVYTSIIFKFLPSIVSKPEEMIYNIVWYERLPRALFAIVAGFGLGIAGAVMQSILRNPLASPFTLGISSGAGFGAALAILAGIEFAGGIVVNAFFFAMLTSLIILAVSKYRGATPSTMILMGIALGYLYSAAITIMEYFSDAWAVREVVFWMVGSLSKACWESFWYMAVPIAVITPFLILKGKELNMIEMSDELAETSGVNVERTRLIMMILTSFITASIICFTGIIGFIGLVAPHIARMAIGGDNRFVIPATGILGALMLYASDIVACNIAKPVILPIGAITSVIGVPVLIYFLLKMKRY